MTNDTAHSSDDTVETGLADDLLGPTGHADAASDASADPTASTWAAMSDDEDYLAPATRRGKLTTGLLVALIFFVGILVGTVLTKTLAPAPAPQIVYVLNDSGTPAPTATPSTPR